jgi:Uma2 family endonuclease
LFFGGKTITIAQRGDRVMATVQEQVPPLAPGDRLTREEFLQLWEAHPEIKKAELIGGTVYMPSPVSVDHGDKENDAGLWMGMYKISTPGIACGHNATSYLLEDAPQADLNLRILPEYGGASWVDENRLLHGIPELLAEICRSRAAYDLHQKLELYQTAGIPEYLAILLFEQEIRWHVLENGVYRLLPPGPDGIWRSGIFPGLWLDGQAFLSGNMPRVLEVLQHGLRSPEHTAFAERLARAKKPG